MTLKPNKRCCSAQVLHGYSKCTGPAGTWHHALANKPSQNPQNWRVQHKTIMKLVCLGVSKPWLRSD